MFKKLFDEFTHSVRQQMNLPAQIRLWSGETFDLGDHHEPKVVIAVKSPSALPHLVNPTLDSLGTAYVTGHVDIHGSLFDVIDLSYALSGFTAKVGLAQSMMARLASAWQRGARHTRASDKRAIQYHYDVSNDFYRLWLDENMLYSCAYFENGDEDLGSAQIKKLDHILRKIRLRPGDTLLDIGCGWGALAIRAAQTYGARVTGVTLSQNQCDFARERVRALGLSEQISIEIMDYRDVRGQFDRITSVGMFEHVGRDNLAAYFSKIASLLKPGGLCMNHGITLSDSESVETPFGGGKFIDTYVFPDGELPHIGAVLQTMQQGGLEAIDVENLRRHYARTLQLWSVNYERHAEAVRRTVEEQQFRIWRVYLAGCSYAFDQDHVAIFQVLCHKAGQAASMLDWSRRYMYAR
ncbi:MAG: class I SAM-dependent methyltransferase [Paludibacterium sp.]|uniref:SAM-dependent methyltransferase n=1 Tax=Paludibacterium sp. TaxID=1917523 RepID=UPI0025DA9DC9|nr:cyclopropane-fatty-acyl-phospholipid synthase family protein [Paludibacterium sp.]MBV8047041.1 class I SAM-dependent methyltransferase [Paludibacterium sp.]MBV8646399.1 class I SAM-dependent methyltransferase [Paludibacterium sp.]